MIFSGSTRSGKAASIRFLKSSIDSRKGGGGFLTGSFKSSGSKMIFPDSLNLVKGLGTGVIIAGAFSWFFAAAR